MENFNIIKKIGEGAYSTVYIVRRNEDDQIYALKKVKIQSLSLKEKQNALNEVRILASIKSPFVIGYKESFIDEVDQTLCIVMEYADEGDLFQKITLYKKLHTTFSENDAWKIFIQITKGLHDLHSYNILHRDLKSANVFLFRDGTAKLGDLNVSKIAARGLGCTQTGTPYYASPEVWKDTPYNLKSDIWSLGCLFYEILMLKTPFRAQTMEGLYRKVMKGKYPEISKQYSNKFDFIISNMLQLKPEDRPTTGDILKLPEVVEKIEELNIYNVHNTIMNNMIKSRINSSKSRDTAFINSSFQSNSPYNNAPTSENKSMNKMFKNNSGLLNVHSNEQSIFETDNNNASKSNIDQICDSASNGNNYMNPRTPNLNNSEIINVLNNNLNYFNQKKFEENKFVLNTIRLPKTLSKLNDKLPSSQYETDYIKSQKNIQGLSFPNKALPILKVRYNSIDSAENKGRNNENLHIRKSIELNPPTLLVNKNAEKNKKNINDDNLFLQKGKNYFERANRFSLQNRNKTLKMMVDKEKPFNYRGQIDIIVEE